MEGVPLSTIHLDHTGPLASTAKRYKHLLVAVDVFSKYVWMFPTRITSFSETLQKIRVLQQHFGNPRRSITDRGTAFTARQFEEYCAAEGIQHLVITTGVPRGNGQVERVNAVIAGVMAKVAADEPEKWFKYVSRVQINGTYHRAIGTSLLELVFGTQIRWLGEIHLQELIEREAAEHHQRTRDELRARARRQIERLQEENQAQYNRRCREATKYALGDLVAIRRTQQGPGLKLAVRFFGPYKVIRCDAHDQYAVRKIGIGEGPNEITASADGMKPWRGFRDDLQEASDDEAETEDNPGTANERDD